jgi:hypothetical protein
MGVYKMDLRKMACETEKWTVYTWGVSEISTENCKVRTMAQNNENN